MLPLCSALFLIWTVCVQPSDAEVDAGLIERCCIIGSNWASRTSGACGAYPPANLPQGISRSAGAEKTSCLALIDVCCGQASRHDQCVIGRNIATTSNTCSTIRVRGGNTEVYAHQKECCECCQLGKLAAKDSQNCNLIEKSGKICERSPDCCGAFYNCCNSTSSTTSGTTGPPITTPSPDVPPVHVPNGICAKFSSALCEHYCHDDPSRPNKFRCTCRRGHELAANQRNCVESRVTCETGNPCDATTAKCFMRRGTPACKCKSAGYRLAGRYRCQDINECKKRTHNCSTTQQCVNSEGSFTCKDCPSNHRLDRLTNTCKRSSDVATPTTCSSNEIYDHVVRSCVSSRPVNSSCPHGYAHNTVVHACEDIDECATGWNNCEVGQRCENSVGSYTCKRRISCGTGYSLQGSSQTCIDIDECQLRTHNCGPAFTCFNIPGSFRCEYKVCSGGERLNVTTGQCVGASKCRQGFVWAEYARKCEDVDECLHENPCLPSERCTNTRGSYRCEPTSSNKVSCFNGFKLNAAGTACEDIDECEKGTHNCESVNHCSNTRGSYRCQCSSGFTLNSVSNTCEDINECSRTFGKFCSPLNSACVNTAGSFHCKCKPGFESIANGRACQDINECQRPSMCQHSCHNVWGSFQCRCRSGYRLAADKRTCNDINECELPVTRGRLCNGFCENIPGSFRCVCPAGFKLSDSGRECLDIDECDNGLSGCNGVNNVCVNTRGSFKCRNVQCPRYFAPAADNLSRSSVRCARQTFVCSQGDAECLTAPLSLSYNFLTLRASRIRIPTELFTMRGPDTFPRIEFKLELKSVKQLARSSIAVTKDNFQLVVNKSEQNIAVVSVVLPIQGQQDIELQLNMNIYNKGGFFGTAAATITIYATVDPWEETGKQ